MSAAYRCEVCDADPLWSVERCGDAVVTWACVEHLSSACMRLQRDFELSQLVTTLFPKAVEWSEIAATLARVEPRRPE